MRKLLTILGLCVIGLAQGQTTSTYRYWFDRDESAIQTGSFADDHLQLDVPTDGLSDWFHILHIQTQDDAGNWSPVISRRFAIVPASTAGSRDLTGRPYRYWFDRNEEGMQTRTLAGNNLVADIPTDGLTDWYHVLHLQTQDDAGNWSPVISRSFAIVPASTAGSRDLTGQPYQYWFDDNFDAAVEGTMAGNVLTMDAAAENLMAGVHVFHLRVRDDAGNWSGSISSKFSVGGNYGDIVPWGQDLAWEARYLLVESDTFEEPATDAADHTWKDLDFDDSEWGMLTRPMANSSGSSALTEVNYTWEGNYNYHLLRRTFHLDSVATGHYLFSAIHDDDIIVYLNGEEVVNSSNVGTPTVEIPREKFVEGENILAIYYKQITGPAYFDYKISCEPYYYAAGALFEAETVEGATMTFQVDNAADKTCWVAADNERPYIDTVTSGTVTIPDMPHGYKVIGIQRGAFYGCLNVTEFVLPETLTRIDTEAFRSCTSLTKLYLPASVTSLGTGGKPWAGCSALKEIVVDDANPVFDSRGNCNAIMVTADNTLWQGCKGTTIPDNTVTIGHSAFDSMGELPALVFPATVTGITAYAFWACSFPSVTSYIETPFETSCAFDHVGADAVLYVPVGKKEAYQSVSEWNNFKMIREIGDPDSYTFTVTAHGHGAVVFDGASIRDGSFDTEIGFRRTEIPLTITPDVGYALGSLKVNGEDVEVEDNSSSYTLGNLTAATTVEVTFVLAPSTQYGDMNTDNILDISDIVQLVNYIIGQLPENYDMELADVNRDGNVDAADLVALVNVMMGEGAEVGPARLPALDASETNDLLTAHITADGRLCFNLQTGTAYTACQMTLSLPAGADITDVQLAAERSGGHAVATGRTEDDRLVLLVYSAANKPFLGKGGLFLEGVVQMAGNGTIDVDDILFVTPKGGVRHFDAMDIDLAAGVESPTWETYSGQSPVYDLAGRRVSKTLSKGIYLKKGKKQVKTGN